MIVIHFLSLPLELSLIRFSYEVTLTTEMNLNHSFFLKVLKVARQKWCCYLFSKKLMECQIDASEVKCCWKIRVVNNRKNAGNMHCKRVHLSVVIDDNGAPLIRLFVLKGCRNRVVWKGKNEEKKKKGGGDKKKKTEEQLNKPVSVSKTTVQVGNINVLRE